MTLWWAVSIPRAGRTGLARGQPAPLAGRSSPRAGALEEAEGEPGPRAGAHGPPGARRRPPPRAHGPRARGEARRVSGRGRGDAVPSQTVAAATGRDRRG